MSLDVTVSAPALTAVAFAALARACLDVVPSALIFDPGLDRSLPETEAAGLGPDVAADFMIGRPLRPAAVLVPIVARDEPTVLLTQRTEHLPNHAGQVAFPGGKLEPGDDSPVAAALREAREEIGLDPVYVSPIGYLDAMRTHTGFHVDPVVAVVEPEFELVLDDREVAAAFEVPLSFLMDPANHQRHARIRDGRRRDYYAMPYQDRFIWGVTAAMIKNMQMRLYPA